MAPEETYSVYKDVRDQINLSDEAKSKMTLGDVLKALDAQNSPHLANVLERSAERSAQSGRVRELADKL